MEQNMGEEKTNTTNNNTTNNNTSVTNNNTTPSTTSTTTTTTRSNAFSSSVCSPPLSLLFKGRKKGKPSFTMQDEDLDDEVCDALCKISKSSEELWKEICSPPSPISSKASSEWIALDQQSSMVSPTSHNAPRIEVDLADSPASNNNSSTSTSSSSYDALRFPSGTNLRSSFPQPPRRNSPGNGAPSLPAPQQTSSSSSSTSLSASNPSSQLPPMFSAPFSNSNNSNNSTSSINGTHNESSLHNNSNNIPMSLGLNPTSSSPTSPSLSPQMHPTRSSTGSSQLPNPHPISIPPASPMLSQQQTPQQNSNMYVSNATLNSPLGLSPSMETQSLSPGKMKKDRKLPQIAPYASVPQLKIHQYIPPGGLLDSDAMLQAGFGLGGMGVLGGMVGVGMPKLSPSSSGGVPNASGLPPNGLAFNDKLRQRENEKCWQEVMMCSNKLLAYAQRGAAQPGQPLVWGDFNETLASARQILNSLAALFQLNSFAYAHVYSTFNSDELLSNQYQRFQQFEPPTPYGTSNGTTLNAMNINNAINGDIKKEHMETEYSSETTNPLMSFSSPYSFEDLRRRIARDANSDTSALSSPVQTITLPKMSTLAPMTPPPAMTMPTLSNLASINASSEAVESPSRNNNERNNTSGTTSGNTSPNTSTSTNNSSTNNGHTKEGNSWKKARGKKRSKYSDMDLMCLSCGVKQTPEWRRGPAGAKTLCNACGLHWAKVLKAEGKGDQKKAQLLEQKRNQFMLLAMKRQENGGDSPHSPIKAEPNTVQSAS